MTAKLVTAAGFVLVQETIAQGVLGYVDLAGIGGAAALLPFAACLLVLEGV